ncbi:MAG: lipoyl domain-containing protein [Desulfonatronovibrionaceae bacterium]
MSRQAYITVIISLGIFCLLDLLHTPKHQGEYFWHVTPAFNAVYGFLGCALIVVVSKAIGKYWLWVETTSVPLPKKAFAANAREVTVVNWFVTEGDQVQEGQELVELKIGARRPIIGSPQSGTIMQRFVDQNDIIRPGETLVNLRVAESMEQVDDRVIING